VVSPASPPEDDESIQVVPWAQSWSAPMQGRVPWGCRCCRWVPGQMGFLLAVNGSRVSPVDRGRSLRQALVRDPPLHSRQMPLIREPISEELGLRVLTL
jgi:hypothetical protein